MSAAGLTLINLDGDGGFQFLFFPTSIQTSDRANWSPQDVTIGTKPLFYANREARELNFPELWLDNTDTNESLTPEIKDLRKLMDETDKGTPPKLLASWGDREEQCVIDELRVDENFFTPDGNPIRARISIRLLQLQSDFIEMTGVNAVDDSNADNGKLSKDSLFDPS